MREENGVLLAWRWHARPAGPRAGGAEPRLPGPPGTGVRRGAIGAAFLLGSRRPRAPRPRVGRPRPPSEGMSRNPGAARTSGP